MKKIPKSGKRAKRPRVVEKSSDESEVESLLGKDQSNVIHSPPKKKGIDHQDDHYVDRNADLDVDKAVDLLVDGGVTQKCDHDVTEKSDEINLDELIQLQDYADEEDLGPELEEKLAKCFLVMAKGKMTDEKLKEKMEKHEAPKNSDIPVPRVNNEIWSVMENGARSADLRTPKNAKGTSESHFCYGKNLQSVRD